MFGKAIQILFAAILLIKVKEMKNYLKMPKQRGGLLDKNELAIYW